MTEYEKKGLRKHFSKENAVKLLTLGAEALESWMTSPMTKPNQPLEALRQTWSLKAAEIIHPTRLAITGRTIGPGLFDIIVLLGKEKTVERMRKAAKWISARET